MFSRYYVFRKFHWTLFVFSLLTVIAIFGVIATRLSFESQAILESPPHRILEMTGVQCIDIFPSRLLRSPRKADEWIDVEIEINEYNPSRISRGGGGYLSQQVDRVSVSSFEEPILGNDSGRLRTVMMIIGGEATYLRKWPTVDIGGANLLLRKWTGTNGRMFVDWDERIILFTFWEYLGALDNDPSVNPHLVGNLASDEEIESIARAKNMRIFIIGVTFRRGIK